ncbi:MAG TPA: hypothetical protein VGO59_01570 [Verrucomicrobiae bacterium]|jgi:hypothetical protein
MSLQGLELFKLMPAVYRLRDAQLAQAQPLLTSGELTELAALQAISSPLSSDQQALLKKLTAKAARGPLESLLMVIQEQLAVLAEDLDQLYDDQFIETCAAWVIPYIGDLIGFQEIKQIPASVDSPRSEVAETISFRRRKGTVLVMEQLARDITGWGAHAVEFFRVLADTQYMNHIRLDNFYAPDLRRWQPGLYMDTGFDRTAHKVDVRRIASGRGHYNIQNIGIFLWSLNAYSVTNSTASLVPPVAAGQPLCYRFSSLGIDIPLFHKAVPQGPEITDPARPVNVPGRLRRRVLCADVQKGVGASYYGPNNSLVVSVNNQPFNPYQIRVCDLSGADGSWANTPLAASPYAALIDPELGRLVLPSTTPLPNVQVSYQYGFNADMGGGEYERDTGPDGFIVEDPAWIFPFPDTASPARYTDLQGALDFAIEQFSNNGEIAVEITDTQTLTATGAPALSITLPAGATLELRSADTARSTLFLGGEMAVSGAANSTFALNGLLIAASQSSPPAQLLHIPADAPDGSPNLLGNLDISHCTFVPGGTALLVEPSGLQVTVKKSILGAMRISPLAAFNACASIIDAANRTGVACAAADGTSGGAPLTLEGCTVIGKVHSTLLTLVSDSICWAALGLNDTWAAPLIADRKQAGCVRFSFLPIGAQVPRQFKCVEQTLGSPQPIFASLRYGRPGYGKLFACTPDAVRRGADDGGEMGAFHFVLAPLRESDLQIRLQEYTPVGLETGIIYET